VSEPTINYPAESGSGLKIPILFGVVIALLAATVSLFWQLDQVRTEMSKMRESLLTEMSNLRETSSVTTQTNRRHLDSIREELEKARRQASMAAGQAKVEAVEQIGALEKKLAEEQSKLARQQQQTKEELSKQVEQVATTATTKIGEVSSDVSAVRTEVARNKSEADKIAALLKRVQGDLGEQSGLIATNAKELGALKALGERNYVEFNLAKTRQPQKVADIMIQLKRTDHKRNRFTIELVADDKKVEKKDRTVNEPLQFYTSKYRQPYELVVNEVTQDRIAGYLAQPKSLAARTPGS
jgi:chromosome segregation ATPase